MRSPKPGVQRRIKWGWHPSWKRVFDSAAAMVITIIFLVAFPVIVIGSTLFGPLRGATQNPVWIPSRVIWFIISVSPEIALLAVLAFFGVTFSVKWLIKNPPIRMTEESPDLREIYRDSELPPPSDVPAIRVMPSKEWK
jgi:hypothetical protein